MITINLNRINYPKMNKDQEVQLKDLHIKRRWIISKTQDLVPHPNSKIQEVEIDFSVKEVWVKIIKHKTKIITKILNK